MSVAIETKGQILKVDKNGNLAQLSDWSPDVAKLLAREEAIELNEAHWEIITVLRDFYHEYQLSPAMRILVKQVALKLGKEKGRSIYLTQLFPPSPAKIASKIAGLPRPDNCL